MWAKTEFFVYAGDTPRQYGDECFAKSDKQSDAYMVAQALSLLQPDIRYSVWYPRRGRQGGFICLATFQNGDGKYTSL
jgi:hypothetical protein